MALLETLLPLAKLGGYDDLLIKPTYLGLKDDKAALPMLIEAYTRGFEPVFTEKLLQRMGRTGPVISSWNDAYPCVRWDCLRCGAGMRW